MFAAGCRLDMHVQPKYLPEDPSNFFDDGRSERQPVPGTVARGQLRLDELLYTGKVDGVEARNFHSRSHAQISNADASGLTYIARPATITRAAATVSSFSEASRLRPRFISIACGLRHRDIFLT